MIWPTVKFVVKRRRQTATQRSLASPFPFAMIVHTKWKWSVQGGRFGAPHPPPHHPTTPTHNPHQPSIDLMHRIALAVLPNDSVRTDSVLQARGCMLVVSSSSRTASGSLIRVFNLAPRSANAGDGLARAELGCIRWACETADRSGRLVSMDLDDTLLVTVARHRQGKNSLVRLRRLDDLSAVGSPLVLSGDVGDVVIWGACIAVAGGRGGVLLYHLPPSPSASSSTSSRSAASSKAAGVWRNVATPAERATPLHMPKSVRAFLRSDPTTHRLVVWTEQACPEVSVWRAGEYATPACKFRFSVSSSGEFRTTSRGMPSFGSMSVSSTPPIVDARLWGSTIVLLSADGNLRAWSVDGRAGLMAPCVLLKARLSSRVGALNIHLSRDGLRLVVDVLMVTLGGSGGSPAEWIQLQTRLDASADELEGTLHLGATKLNVCCRGGVRAAFRKAVLTTRGYRWGYCCSNSRDSYVSSVPSEIAASAAYGGVVGGGGVFGGGSKGGLSSGRMPTRASMSSSFLAPPSSRGAAKAAQIHSLIPQGCHCAMAMWLDESVVDISKAARWTLHQMREQTEGLPEHGIIITEHLSGHLSCIRGRSGSLSY